MWAAVQRDAALMNGNPYAHLEQRGISLHLVPWSAVLCRGVPWLASGFPGGLWTDGAVFRRDEHSMKLNRFYDESFLMYKVWEIPTCSCSICQIEARGNIFLCMGASNRQGASYARANETASASPKSSLEIQLANRPRRKNVTGKKTRRTARKQDGVYYARHDYKTPGGKQGAKCHYIVTT